MALAGEQFLDERIRLYPGDCRDVLRMLDDNSIDSVVTDPPYALVSIVKRFGAENAAPVKVPGGGTGAYMRASRGFMGKQWDTGETAFAAEFWAEVLRVLKPGGHVIAMAGTRTYHHLAMAIEAAGFEIRDQLAWAYGSGFPKSHDVSKGIDKACRRDFVLAAIELGLDVPGNSLHDWTKAEHSPGDRWWDEFKQRISPEDWRAIERAVIRSDDKGRAIWGNCNGEYDITAPATDAARQWEGWGTALKPAWEPIVLARKPLSGTVAANVLEHGTGAINVDGCRIHAEDAQAGRARHGGGVYTPVPDSDPSCSTFGRLRPDVRPVSPAGRWPANLVHDGSDEVVGCFPETGGAKAERTATRGGSAWHGRESFGSPDKEGVRPADSGGSAARFFYTAKADAEDRLGSKHPTVKPVDLMQWLVRLVTPKRVLCCPHCENRSVKNDSAEKASPAEELRSLSEGISAEGQSAHGEVLQSAMCGGVEGPEAEALRVVRSGVPATEGRGEEVLQPGVRGEMGRQEPEHVARVCDEQGGLQVALDAGSSSVPCPEGLHFRAPMGDAEADREATNTRRGRASQKRDKGRQPTGELGDNAQGGSRQTESTPSERADMPPLRGPDNHKPTCSNCGRELGSRPGVCLDPFAGTGTTGEAAFREGLSAVLVEREEEYLADIRERMRLALAGPEERARALVKRKQGEAPPDLGPLFEQASLLEGEGQS